MDIDNTEFRFEDLPLDKKYNHVIRHNKKLIAKNDLLNDYISSLEYQLKNKPVTIHKEVVTKKVVRVPTPDAIGNSLVLGKQIRRLREQIIQLTNENKNLKQALKLIR